VAQFGLRDKPVLLFQCQWTKNQPQDDIVAERAQELLDEGAII
jgi:hypothetical protein